MQEIHLVRHAETAQNPDVASTAWSLTDAGHRAAQSLSGLPQRVFSSPEPKALQTAAGITSLPVTMMEEFREHASGLNTWLSAEDFALTVERYFTDRIDRVWGDSHAETTARFHAGLERVNALCEDMQSCTIVTHGRILCSFLGSLNGTSGYEIWKLLTMPSVVKLIRKDGRLRIETISLFH